jgi:secondary thiamine-phosphate synthase enzyme
MLPEIWSYTRDVTTTHGELQFETEGHGHTVDLTGDVDSWLGSIAAREGLVSVFVPGSTGAVTTIEYETGALRDLDEALERIAPSNRTYHHDRRWGDGNGFSHLRAALLGPSIAVPVAAGRCVLGTWQQIVLVECDVRPRRRRVVLSFSGSRGSEA